MLFRFVLAFFYFYVVVYLFKFLTGYDLLGFIPDDIVTGFLDFLKGFFKPILRFLKDVYLRLVELIDRVGKSDNVFFKALSFLFEKIRDLLNLIVKNK